MEDEINLTIVLEYRQTFAGKFNRSAKVLQVCMDALHSVWDEPTQPVEWKVCDRYGNVLQIDEKLGEVPVRDRETLYMSKKVGDVSSETPLVEIEEKIEQKAENLKKSIRASSAPSVQTPAIFVEFN